MLNKKTIGAFVAAATLLSGFAFASLTPVAFANDGTGDTNQTEHSDNDVIKFADEAFERRAKNSMHISPYNDVTVKQAREYNSYLDLGLFALSHVAVTQGGTPSIEGDHLNIVSKLDDLQYFPNVTNVSLSGNEVSDFSPLAKLKHLNSLSLKINESKAANAKLPYIENLKKLDLSGNGMFFITEGYKLTNLKAVSNLKDLEELEVSSGDLTSLSGVESLAKLKKLTIEFAKNLTDLTPISGLTNLEELNIKFANIKDISCLKGLTKIKKLSITGNESVDLSIPDTLTNLEELEIHDAKITNLNALSKFTKLKKLSINVSDKTTNLSFVRSLNNLKELRIDGLNISDVSALEDISNNLTNVYIWSSKLSNLKSFAKLINLKELTVGWEVSDISGVENLSKLEKLSISGSDSCDKKLSDLKPLENLTNLTELDISQASVPNVSVFNKLTKLTELSLDESDGEIDISGLKILNNLEKLSLRCSKVKNLASLNSYAGKWRLRVELNDEEGFNPGAKEKLNNGKLALTIDRTCYRRSCINRSNVPNLPGYVPGHVPGHGSGSVPGTGSINNGSVNPDWNLFDPDEPDDFADLLDSLNSDGSGDSVSNTVSDSSTSALDSLTPALDDNIDFSEMLNMSDFDVDALGDLSDFGNMNVGDFTGTDSVDNSGDAGIPSGVDDFNIDDFDLSDFDFADLLDYLGDLDLDDLAPADVADADSSAPAVPVGVGVVIR